MTEPRAPEAQLAVEPPTDWSEVAARELGGASLDRLTSRTRDGIAVAPLYTPADKPGDHDLEAPPGVSPFVRGARSPASGGGWLIRQVIDDPDPNRAAAAARLARSQGADSLWIRVDEASAAGFAGSHGEGRPGVVLRGEEDLAALLEGVELGARPVFEAGALGPRIAAAALDRARARGDDLAGLELTVGCDPLGALARYGGLSVDLERAFAELAALFSAVPAVAPRVRLALVSSIHYADAGATASEELALLIASGVELLDRLGAAGLSASTVAPRILFAMSVGRDLFGELAKLRAARLLWARVVLALGGDAQAGAAALHVEGAWRELTRVDPWVNLIRGAAAGLVGALGGVESAATHAFTAVDGPDEDARRWAVNTQLILREEAHLGRALDPAGGAWYVEALTDQLARAAWTRVRELLAAGGVAAELRSGAIQARLADQAAAQAQAAAQVREPLTGVSRFPALDEAIPPVAPRRAVGLRDPVDRSREREGAAERATPLPRARLAAGFEALRAEPPVVARLLVVGERAGLRARVDFVRGLLASGGIACPGDLVHADAEAALADYLAAPAGLVVLCAADADYAALVARLVAPLRASGAQVVALAGRPREEAPALRAAGVDLFLHLGCDVIAAIRALRDRLGAAR